MMPGWQTQHLASPRQNQPFRPSRRRPSARKHISFDLKTLMGTTYCAFGASYILASVLEFGRDLVSLALLRAFGLGGLVRGHDAGILCLMSVPGSAGPIVVVIVNSPLSIMSAHESPLRNIGTKTPTSVSRSLFHDNPIDDMAPKEVKQRYLVSLYQVTM
jgi:hypothetical protein